MISSTFKTLPESTTVLYSELFQQVKSSEALRSIGHLKGTFVKKKIKNKNYWYLQYHEAGKQRQVYLGLESKELLSIFKAYEKGKLNYEEDASYRKKLSAMLVKGGLLTPDAASAKSLQLLSESGIFKLGAVLVGTHAFQVYASLFGVQWNYPYQTQDIDLAQEKNLSIALSDENTNSDLPGALERAKMGFFPIPRLNPKHPSTSFKIQGKQLHVDILTPMIGKELTAPVHLPALKVSAQALRFLDYLIEDPIEAVIPYDAGILVNVPQSARFAFHKLLISTKRDSSFHAKSKKDVAQAGLLFEILLEQRAGEVLLAWEDLKGRGKKWVDPILKVISQQKAAWAKGLTKELKL